MPDQYQAVRSLPFPAVAGALGLDTARFKRSGHEYVGPCPVHQPKKNTGCFRYQDDGKFNCFGCKDAHGRGAIDFVRAVRQCGFKDAVALLEQLAETTTQSESRRQTRQETREDQPHETIKPYRGSYEKFQVPCEWLERRLPDQGVREHYGVFAYNNAARKSAYSGRVMIPVKDISGTLYGYLGRLVPSCSRAAGTHPSQANGEPSGPSEAAKYLFPRDLPKSHFLFGAAELASGTFGPLPLKYVYLVESPFAVMRFAMYGLPAVSAFGWSVSTEQCRLLASIAKGIVYLPDRNKANQCDGVVGLLAQTVWVRFPQLPEGVEDPEHLSSRESILTLHS